MLRKLSLHVALALFTPFAAMVAAPAWAEDNPMRRVRACTGPDAGIEVYLPESVVSGSGLDHVDLAMPVKGLYTLDLSAAGKGKVLERVRVSLADDGKAVIIEQFTRRLPPTRVAVEGAVVDFDKRFATEVMCPEFNVDAEFD